MDFDPGPPRALANLFSSLPDHRQWKSRFRLEWGPVFYRGRSDGSARVLVVGQDASSEEDVARRVLVGLSGRRVQGFLAKAGLTRSYVMVNAFAYSIFGQFDDELREISEDPALLAYRNAVFDFLSRPGLEAVIAFGRAAAHAVEKWPGASGLFVAEPQHPSARRVASLLASWRSWVPRVRVAVSADPDGSQAAPNYGNQFLKSELPGIPDRDLPFGMPSWFGKRNLKTTTRLTRLKIGWTAPAAVVG
jgi:hypothetical protein